MEGSREGSRQVAVGVEPVPLGRRSRTYGRMRACNTSSVCVLPIKTALSILPVDRSMVPGIVALVLLVD